jgi:hypothetical protein
MTRQPIANPVPSLTVEALKQLIGEVMAEQGKKARTDDIEIATVRAFKRNGYGEVKPHQDVKTYNRWIAAGRRVRPGEQSVKVRQRRLFHISQTEEISEAEKAAFLAQKEARTAELSKVMPVEAPKDDAKPAPKAKGKPVLVPGSGSMQ